jgi:hypothetical protein
MFGNSGRTQQRIHGYELRLEWNWKFAQEKEDMT